MVSPLFLYYLEFLSSFPLETFTYFFILPLITVQASKQIDLRFLLNPIKFVPDKSESSRLGSVVCERTRLEGEPGHQVAVGTGEQETIQANLVGIFHVMETLYLLPNHFLYIQFCFRLFL